jgi:hypothetical protein
MRIQPCANPVRDTTVLVYTSASADLEKPVRESLDELAGEVHRPDIQVVAQMGWAGQGQRELLGGTDKESVPSLDMSQPAALEDFLKWGMSKYPAKHYVVVMGGHGAGSFGAVTNSQRTHMMQLPEIRQAIEDSGCRPQMLIFNTCLGDQAESAAEFRDVTPVVVGSQTEQDGLGMPLGGWLAKTQGLDDPRRAAAELVAECATVPDRSPSISAISTDGSRALDHQLDQLGQAMRQNPELREQLRDLIASQPHPWKHEWDHPLVDEIDLGHLANALANDQTLPDSLRTAGQGIKDQLATMVIGAGLSLYAPHTPWAAGPVGAIYGRLRLPHESGWAQTLNWLTSAPAGECSSSAPAPSQTGITA